MQAGRNFPATISFYWIPDGDKLGRLIFAGSVLSVVVQRLEVGRRDMGA
jgi:hypothetical protein